MHLVIHLVQLNNITGDLSICRTAAKFVPHLLTFNQKDLYTTIWELCKQVNDDPTFISRIIIVELFYSYELETKLQSSQCKST